MERIEFAKLTEDHFEVPSDFDGPTLLKRAWGVMYGDEELLEVRLRFSHWVTKRVKETLWHPSQQIADTTDVHLLFVILFYEHKNYSCN